MDTVTLMWFRRDLRLTDNAALYHALKGENPVVPIFIFDKNILDKLDNTSDRRVQFIHASLRDMQMQLQKKGSSIECYYGFPEDVFKELLSKYEVRQVFTNVDYEPYATARDNRVATLLKKSNVPLHTYKDQVIFHKSEVVKDDGKPYTVFTPYSKRWRSTLNDFYLKPYPTEKYFKNFYKQKGEGIPSLESMGFNSVDLPFPSSQLKEELIKKYDKTRDYPAVQNGTSRLGVHLRFGTVSIRKLATLAKAANETYLNELIWREFYQMILWHFPELGNGHAFKPQYEKIKWRNNETEFKQWCEGNTGYPIVDAGMRELNATGFMHNRVRMITASFLTKHLLIDWRWGEAYFADKLLDFDLASNNGGWQWAAGCGCDAAPYFRVFNPELQTQKFDKQLDYIKRWVPEFQEFTYPKPMVQHEVARKRALQTYGNVLKQA